MVRLALISIFIISCYLTASSGSPVDKFTSDEQAMIKNKDNKDFQEGDMYNPPNSVNTRSVGIKQNANIWKNKIVHYTISNGQYNSREQATIRKTLKEMQAQLGNCIQFKESSSGHSIKIVKKNGCYSSVGKNGVSVFEAWGGSSSQELSLGNGCVVDHVIKHEFMHALGFSHEQNRPDRDNYITIDFSNIDPNQKHNYQKRSRGNSADYGTSYDFDSVMHYSNGAFSINGQDVMRSIRNPSKRLGLARDLSYQDIHAVKSMYGCRWKCIMKRIPIEKKIFGNIYSIK